MKKLLLFLFLLISFQFVKAQGEVGNQTHYVDTLSDIWIMGNDSMQQYFLRTGKYVFKGDSILFDFSDIDIGSISAENADSLGHQPPGYYLNWTDTILKIATKYNIDTLYITVAEKADSTDNATRTWTDMYFVRFSDSTGNYITPYDTMGKWLPATYTETDPVWVSDSSDYASKSYVQIADTGKVNTTGGDIIWSDLTLDKAQSYNETMLNILNRASHGGSTIKMVAGTDSLYIRPVGIMSYSNNYLYGNKKMSFTFDSTSTTNKYINFINGFIYARRPFDYIYDTTTYKILVKDQTTGKFSITRWPNEPIDTSGLWLYRADFADSLKNCHDTISASVIHACSKLDIDADTITGQPVWTGDFRLTGGQIRASSVPLVLSTENVGDIELAPVSGDSIFLDASGAGITYIQSSAMIEEHLKFTDNNTEIFKSVATNDLVFQDINSGLIKLATLDTGRVSTSGDDIYGNINITSKKAYKQNNVNLIRIPSGSETSLCIGNSGNNTFYKKNNTLIGDSAGYSLNTGQRNTFIGSLAGQYCDSTDNLFIGIGAGRYRNVNNNIGIGYVALRGAVGTATGNFNTALGNYAGYNTTTGTDNVFIGYDAGANNNTGYYNVYIGNYAGYAGTTANNNMAFGRSAMNYVTTGYENVAIGSNSLVYNQAGLFNVAIGSSAMYGVSGNSCTRNTIIGYKGAYLVRTAQYNTGIGYQVFYNINNGEANSAVGFNAGNSLTTGNYNCYFGRDAGFSNQTGASNVFIGYQAGYSETGSNKLYIDNSNTATPLIYGDFSADYLKINGGEKAKNNIYTTTQVLNHANNFVYADGTSGAVDITLPTGTIYNETVYYIKCINADNTVRIVADGADTIDGAATVTLALNDSYILQYIFSKNKWYIF